MARVNRLYNPFSTSYLRTLVAACLLLPSLVIAQLITPYPNATLELEVQEARNNHPVVSSPMKKVNGVVLADRQTFLNGWLDRRLYQIPAGHGSNQAFDHFTAQFAELGVNVLYRCEQFSCGDSHFWAHTTFDIPRLYGQDKTQAYLVGTIHIDGQPAYISIYTVRRGNRRVYALVDLFTPDKSGSDRVLLTEEFPLEQLPTDVESFQGNRGYARIRDLLQPDGVKKVLLLIESSLPPSLAELDQLTGTVAKTRSALAQQLKKDGINPARLRIQPSILPVGESDGRVRLRILKMD